MKIALVTDDHQTISAHFGRARFYEVFTIESGRIIARETHTKDNHKVVALEPQTKSNTGHQHQHDHNAMIAPIADCQAVLTRGMGWGAHTSLKEHGIQPIITDIHEIQAAVEAYIAGTLVNHPELLH